MKQYIPSREALLSNRFIKPFAHRLSHPGIWHFNRRSTARGVALGIFLGFIIPIGQTPAAAALAVTVRCNVIAASAATLITNPLTFPAIYYGAYWTGNMIIEKIFGNDTSLNAGGSVGASGTLWTVTAPLATGLLAFALFGAAAGYLSVHLIWRLSVKRRWRARAQGATYHLSLTKNNGGVAH